MTFNNAKIYLDYNKKYLINKSKASYVPDYQQIKKLDKVKN